MKDKILITGCSGFIGQRIIKYFKNKNYYLIGIDKLALSVENDLDYFVNLDLSSEENKDKISEILNDVNTVIHLAAAKADWGLDYNTYYKDNCINTQILLDCCKGKDIKTFIHYSTVGVLPQSQNSLDENTLPNPDTDYGRTKLIAEELISSQNIKKYFQKIIIIRPSAVFGINQPADNNIYRLINAIKNKKFLMIGNGEEIKTMSYIEELVNVTYWLFVNVEDKFSVWHYVDEPKISTRELVNTCYKEIHNKISGFYLPKGIVILAAKIFDFVGKVINVDLPITSMRIKKFCTATNFSSKKLEDKGYIRLFESKQSIIKTIKWQIENNDK